MKKNLKIVIYVLALILVSFIVYKLITHKEVPFNKVILNKHNYVFNMTQTPYLDTIVSVGLDQMKMDSVIVTIKPLNSSTSTDLFGEISISSYIVGYGNTYIIYITPSTKMNCINILSHELIHLNQYYSKTLVVKGLVCTWKGDTIDTKKIAYESRPWEIDAESNKILLSSKIKAVLIK
jgi:predicted metallopeptidase